MRRYGKLAWWSALALFAAAPVALAADHLDGTRATSDPAADITDLFAWMTGNGQQINLVMDVFPGASSTSQFSPDVQYVFHTRSQASAVSATGTEEDVICEFDQSQNISCWAGDSFVTGNADNGNGITSTDGKMKVFAGLRDDPFFFNLTGFKKAAGTVAQAKGTLTANTAGCPTLNAATRTTLVNQLQQNATGGTATDDFAMKNVLAIVIQIDKSVLTRGGSAVTVWASTNHKP